MNEGGFKVKSGLQWQDAVSAPVADLSSNSLDDVGGVVYDPNTIGVGDILVWSADADGQGNGGWISSAAPAGGGGESPFVPNTSDAGKMDGHLIPDANNTYDIGSAEFKIRDLYVSDASLWVGDMHKISVSDGKMRFLKRRTDKVPSRAEVNDFVADPADGNRLKYSSNGSDQFNGGTALDGVPLESFSLAQWKRYEQEKGLAQDVYDKDEELDWEQDDAQVDSYIVKKTNQNTSYLKKFHVAVDNKTANTPQPNGSGNAFYIDGVPQPELRLKAGTYRFYQMHISNKQPMVHPLGFYDQETGGGLVAGQNFRKEAGNVSFPSQNEYSASLSASNDLNGDGHYVELVVDSSLPAEFWYQCGNHPQMGWKVINEAAGSGGGASDLDDLNNVDLSNGLENGDGLIYEGGQFVPKPVMQGEIISVKHVANNNPNSFDLVSDLQGGIGGRILLDLDNNTNGLDIEIDLEALETNRPKTMNFEIFSKGTTPFDVKVYNSDSVGPRTLNSMVSPEITLDGSANNQNGEEELITIGEGQMMLLYCDGANWYYEIRAGL